MGTMQTTVTCERCAMMLGVPASAQAQRVQCPGCGAVFSVGPSAGRRQESAADAATPALGHNAAFAWTCVCIVTLVLAGGVGALTWQLSHRATLVDAPALAQAVQDIPEPPPQVTLPPAQVPTISKTEPAPAPEKSNIQQSSKPGNKAPNIKPLDAKPPDSKPPDAKPPEVKAPKQNVVELDASPKPRAPDVVIAQATPPKKDSKEKAGPQAPMPTLRPGEGTESLDTTKNQEKNADPNAPKVRILDFNVPNAPAVGNTGATRAELTSRWKGRVSVNLGAVFDVDAKAALLLLPGGQAKLFDYPTFKSLASYKLGGGTAYYSAYDKAKARLYVLSPSAKAKDPTNKPGGSQVVCYDVRGVLDGRLNAHAQLAPVKVISLGGFCTHLCLAPDGAWLFALDGKAHKVLRVNCSAGKVDASAGMPPYTDGLSLASDGRRLYALAPSAARTAKGPLPNGIIVVIEAPSLAPVRTMQIAADPFALAATKDEVVFVSSRGGVRGDITVLDCKQDSAQIAIWRGVPPNARLKLSEDEKSLYLTYGGNVGYLACVPLPEAIAGSDTPKMQWAQRMPASAHGDMSFTPDHQYLLADSGVVLVVADGN